MGGKDDVNTAPRAFLNYIIFDSEMNYISAGFDQISTAGLSSGPNTHDVLTINDIIPDQEGYILAYLSNENQESIDIYFDDFTVVHGKTNVVSTQDYYPFGLTFNESVRTASKEQNFLYNNKELQEGTDWLDYGARMYQPEIGRFFRPDRFTEKYYDLTPYQYGANSPINYIDVNGDSLWIQVNKNNRALYADGKLYNQDGTQYNGKGTKVDKNGKRKLTGFLKSAVSNLDKVSSGKEGNKMVDELQNSSDNVTITQASAGSGNSYDAKTNTVKFDLSSQNGGLNTTGTTLRPTFLGLGHELAHSLDDVRGTISGKPVGNTIQAEIFASHKENQLRAENGEPLRVHYRSSGGTTPIIDAQGNSIYYNTNYYNALNVKPKGIRLAPVNVVPPSKLNKIN